MLRRKGALDSTSAMLKTRCSAGTIMQNENGALESTSAALGPWNPLVRRWNHNAAQELGAGIHQCHAKSSMLHKNGALQCTTVVPEP